VLGGLFAVCIAALAARVVLGLDARYTDALAVALPAGFAIGRIGCFLAGCCAGAPTDLPWGVHYQGSAEAVHPTQLYEAAGGLLIALAARHQLRTRRDILIPGVVLPYLALRFGLQFLREHNRGTFGRPSCNWASEHGCRRAPKSGLAFPRWAFTQTR
ncbi:MAG: prolipoprotein diacylglyceryl transferase family protein, partial [Longimicrobiales bacterium]